jgi:hypothetical protein
MQLTVPSNGIESADDIPELSLRQNQKVGNSIAELVEFGS